MSNPSQNLWWVKMPVDLNATVGLYSPGYPTRSVPGWAQALLPVLVSILLGDQRGETLTKHYATCIGIA